MGEILKLLLTKYHPTEFSVHFQLHPLWQLILATTHVGQVTDWELLIPLSQ